MANKNNTSQSPPPLFIEKAASQNDREFWHNFDEALEEGHQAWVRSHLLEYLYAPLGAMLDGKEWLLIQSGVNRAAKGMIWARDMVFACLALIVLLPFMLMVAILIKISSPGPVFFKTYVIGERGRKFIWRKFRSMRVMPEKDDIDARRERFRAYVAGRHTRKSSNAPTKIIDDARVTSVGWFIRKYSIDELPQLWNVLRGEMALVGPRPCLPYEAEIFTDWRKRRFNVKPGLTGLWQVFGRGRVGFDEGAAMDVFYLYRRSFLFDFYLILKTVGVVLSGRGAR